MYVSRGQKLKPNGAWINDLLREEMGEPYAEGEPRLPRNVQLPPQ
jgi:alpha,alpha-trehalose phosphorylase (configuration-retaining)